MHPVTTGRRERLRLLPVLLPHPQAAVQAATAVVMAAQDRAAAVVVREGAINDYQHLYNATC